jgi:hypothetical protein
LFNSVVVEKLDDYDRCKSNRRADRSASCCARLVATRTLRPKRSSILGPFKDLRQKQRRPACGHTWQDRASHGSRFRPICCGLLKRNPRKSVGLVPIGRKKEFVTLADVRRKRTAVPHGDDKSIAACTTTSFGSTNSHFQSSETTSSVTAAGSIARCGSRSCKQTQAHSAKKDDHGRVDRPHQLKR